MAKGWSGEDDAQKQIDDTVGDAVARARSRLPAGESLRHCEDCGQPIPRARREAIRGVRRCVPCQEQADAAEPGSGGYNRRGSKDSQLR